MPHDPRSRLRGLLCLMAGLALVSVGVNYRWWRQHVPARRAAASETVAASGGRADRPAPDPLALQLEQARWGAAAHPEDDSARLAFARRLFLAGRFPDAVQQLQILHARLPRRPEVDYWLALALRQSRQVDAALTSIQRARRLEPNSALYREELGEIYLAQGRSGEAADTFDACLKQQPGSYPALMGKARAMEQLYEAKMPVAIPEIVTPVRKAVSLQPENPWGVTVLARMSFAYLQQFGEAERLANQAIQIDPRQAEPYLILVETYLADSSPARIQQAVIAARQAARLDPHSPQPLYLLGRALLRQNDIAGAIDALEQSTRVQLMPEAVYQLSLAYARAGKVDLSRHYSQLYESWSRFTERRHLLLALLQHRPRDAQLHAQLAELYLSQGAAEPARNWLRRGLQLRPRDARLHRLLVRAGLTAAGEDKASPVDAKTRKVPSGGEKR